MNPLPEFACTDEALEKLEAALTDAPQAPCVQRLASLLPVAWQLRQRDTTRALLLADEAEACLAVTDLAAGERLGMAARLSVIRGEAKALQGELDVGAALAGDALRDFAACNDAIGCADAHWLQALIALDQGDPERRDTELVAMEASARIDDPVRFVVAKAWRARNAAFRDVAAARRDWGPQFATGRADMHPAACAWVEDFFALTASFSGEYVDAIRHFGTCHTLALATGQIRQAEIAASNLGESFNDLNDHHAALDWFQRGLELVRPRAWPASMGGALMQTAETLRLLQRFDAAHALLREAMALTETQAASQDYAIALGYLGEVELDLQQYADALASFQLLEQRGRALDMSDLLCRSLRGQANALLALNLPQAALAQAHAALNAAKSEPKDQIGALRVLADIHARHSLPPPPSMSAASAPLHYLQQAHDLANAITSFTIPGDLLEALAEQHAKTGDFAKAWQLAKQAIAAHAKIHSIEAANRASALQVSHQTQRAWAEGEHHRKLAAAHAARADALEQANSTLEELGAVGRDITANLETHAIFTALDTHVHALLDTSCFLIYRLETDGQTLRMVYGVEAGQSCPSHALRLDNQESHAARCARQRTTLVVDVAPDSGGLLPGTLDTLSLMYAPLVVGERLLGVMTIQTVHPRAYHARETAIFSTLCAWAAIALANTESQAQMVQHEKMASLGQLVANVAHEINTPIGAVKSSGASIAEALGRLLTNLPRLYRVLDDDQQVLFQDIINQARQQSAILSSREERSQIRQTTEQLVALAGLNMAQARQQASVLVQLRAHADPAHLLPLLLHPDSGFILDTANGVAAIINSSANINTAVVRVSKIVFALKAFARVEHGAEMMLARLQDGLDTVLTIHHSQIQEGITLVQHYDDIAPLRCLPDELNQVWSNLISNALHAMNYRGTLTMGIRQEDGHAVVSVSDSGCGIAPTILGRIFDPFFTTKPTGEGSGLGLDIAKKIVAKHKGRIEVQSEVGVGTTFSVYLPYS
jgi:signal transduction histidine kinase/tetratricopeptide (TPR) repeat protein